MADRKARPSALIDDEPEIPEVSVGIQRPDKATVPRPAVALDLTGHPKCWLFVGRGRTGKTTLIRWIAERAGAAGTPVVLTDLDRTNATLTSYLSDVIRAPVLDDAGTVQWLQNVIGNTMTNRASTLIDLGGGDTALAKLAEEVPNLDEIVRDGGAELVIAYLVGPQPDDLSPLATMRHLGLKPPATVIVLNEGLLGPGMAPDTGFTSIRRHSVFKAAIDDGAAVVQFPRLLPAGEVERRRISFVEARDALVEPALGPFDRARIRHWLDQMDHEFNPIASWLP